MATARVISVNSGHAVDASCPGALQRTAIDQHPVAAAEPAGVPSPAAAVRPAAPAPG